MEILRRIYNSRNYQDIIVLVRINAVIRIYNSRNYQDIIVVLMNCARTSESTIVEIIKT